MKQILFKKKTGNETDVNVRQAAAPFVQFRIEFQSLTSHETRCRLIYCLVFSHVT
jgi:hypothetical protein